MRYLNYFQNKNIVITGAAAGIGKDLSILLSSYNANLCLIDINEQGLKETKSLCHTSAQIFQADIVDIEKMREISKKVLESFDHKVDIVIANAGLGGINPANNFSPEFHKKIVEVNMIGLTNSLCFFVDSMIKRKSGTLVGISSLAAFRGLPQGASYSGSKAGQRIIMESFRADLKKHGIRSLSIHPGFIETAMSDHGDFPTPFKLTPRQSSVHIAKAIAKKKSLYLYPMPMKLLTWINRLLPNWLYDLIIPKINNSEHSNPTIYSANE